MKGIINHLHVHKSELTGVAVLSWCALGVLFALVGRAGSLQTILVCRAVFGSGPVALGVHAAKGGLAISVARAIVV